MSHKLVNEFRFGKAYKYSKKEIKRFLLGACTNHSGRTLVLLTDRERSDLQALWKNIFEPYFSGDCPRGSSCTCKDKLYHGNSKPKKPCCESQIRLTYNGNTRQFTLNPVIVHLHGIEIPIYSIHCALAAVLTITLMPPDLSSKKVHDHAYCLASLLGKWCFVIVDENANFSPSMIFLMYGTSSSSSNPSTILWSCGVSKSTILRELDQYQRKAGRLTGDTESLMQSWRVSRQEMVDNAIGVSFSGKELPGSRPPRSKEAAAEFLRGVAQERKEDAIGIEKIYQRRVRLPEVPDGTIWRFGDCAESVPVTLVANTCQGYAIAIALRPEDICNLVRGINKANEIMVRDPVRDLVKPEPSCQICQWSFAGLEHKKQIEVQDREDRICDTFKMLELNISAPRRLI